MQGACGAQPVACYQDNMRQYFSLPTFTHGSSLAFGMSRDGPSRRPLAFVPTHRLSRLAGSSDGIVTKPYDLTFTQVICKAAKWHECIGCLLLAPGMLTHGLRVPVTAA